MLPKITEHSWIDPARVFRAARGLPGVVFLDSGGPPGPMARWSVLAFEPLEVLREWIRPPREDEDPRAWPFSGLASLYARWQERLGGAGRLGSAGRLGGAGSHPLRGGGTSRSGSGLASDVRAHPPFTGAAGSHPLRGGAMSRSGTTSAADASAHPPFTGGVIAALGYDLGRAIEVKAAASGSNGRSTIPDLWAAAYDGAIVVDRLRRRVWTTVWSGGAEGRVRGHALDAVLEDARDLRLHKDFAQEDNPGPASLLSSHTPEPGRPQIPEPDPPRGETPEASRVDQWPAVSAAKDLAESGRDAFLSGVIRIKEEIARGEIYQANLTRRVVENLQGRQGWAIYERLRRSSPTPFGAFVDAGDFQLLSASPERFIEVVDGWVQTRPIKGTRPRGATREEDRALADALLLSEKDRAELLMIVDLERNDLGRVCETGSVVVDDWPALEAYSTVWHLVANVRGRLRPDSGVTDLLHAVFPGGSISGAPKIRAMAILDELERQPRQFSMGSLLAWGLDGSLDSSILIRTMTLHGGLAVFHVGGGIVAESDPAEEFRETQAKAAPLLRALGAS